MAPAAAASLARTTTVVKEAMRLYPPLYGIGRRTVADDTVGGYRLPAGSVLLVSPWATHRHPRHWDRPEAFDPERFTPEAVVRAFRLETSPGPVPPATGITLRPAATVPCTLTSIR